MLKLYGIPSCNTVRKAMNWLKDNDIEFEFHDYKKKSIDKKILQQWVAQVGWETLINKKGTTWKDLDISLQTSITNEALAIDLMVNCFVAFFIGLF